MKLWLITLSIIIVLMLLEAYFLIDEICWALEAKSLFSIFWLDIYSVQIKLSLTCLVIPTTLITIVFISRKFKEPKFRFTVVTILMLVFTIGIGLCTLPIGIARYTEKQTQLSFENRVYQIAHSYATFGIDSDPHPYIDLYECDALGFLCQKVFRYQWKFLKPTIEWSENHQWQSTLIPNSATHTITLKINDEVVYVHQVK